MQHPCELLVHASIHAGIIHDVESMRTRAIVHTHGQLGSPRDIRAPRCMVKLVAEAHRSQFMDHGTAGVGAFWNALPLPGWQLRHCFYRLRAGPGIEMAVSSRFAFSYCPESMLARVQPVLHFLRLSLNCQCAPDRLRMEGGADLKKKVVDLSHDVAGLRAEVATLKAEISTLKEHCFGKAATYDSKGHDPAAAHSWKGKGGKSKGKGGKSAESPEPRGLFNSDF